MKIDAEVDPQTMAKATDACRTLNPGAGGNQDSVDPDAVERSYEWWFWVSALVGSMNRGRSRV